MRRELTDTQCRATRKTLLDAQEQNSTRTFKLPREKRTIKLTDGGGLYLEVPPNDQRGWRWTYTRPQSHPTLAGKPNVLSLGTYPEVSLADARIRCDAARALVAQNIDPSEHKMEVARAAIVANAVTFQKIADDWFAEAHADHDQKTKDRDALEMKVLTDAFGTRAIHTIEPIELGELLKPIFRDGRKAKAGRIRRVASRIWRYAISEAHCKYDIAANFEGRFKYKRDKYPAITDRVQEIMLPAAEDLVGKLLRDIRGYNDNRSQRMIDMALTRSALEFMALTVPRPLNIRRLRWSQIVADPTRKGCRVMVISAEEMKMDKPLRVPLSRQACEILDRLEPHTGKSKGGYVFTLNGKPMGKNSMTRALDRLGYDTTTQHCAHGFRSVFATLCTEWGGWSVDAIELSLAHRDEDQIRGTYTKAGMWDERCKLMQHYADCLDTLRDGGHVGVTNVVPFTRAA